MMGMRSPSAIKDRRKVTWGSRVVLTPMFMLALTLVVPQPLAFASQKTDRQQVAHDTNAQRKLDRAIRDLAEKASGETDVIVQFTDNADDTSVIRGFGKAGRRLNLIQGRVLRVPVPRYTSQP